MPLAVGTFGSSSIGDFLARVLKQVTPLRPLQLALLDAVGGVLSEEVYSPYPLPACDTADIDGYAVISDDLRGASESEQVLLPVVGDIRVGSWHSQRLVRGATFTISKGAPLPAGADAVLPAAWTDGGLVTTSVHRGVRKEYGVVRTGALRQANKLLASAGQQINPAMAGLLAAAGFNHVPARPRPRLIAMAVGAEYVDSGPSVGAGHTTDAASYVVTGGAREAGAQAFRMAALGDDPERVRATLADNAMRADILITTGDTRLVTELFNEIGLVRMSVVPEGDLAFGLLGSEGTPLLGLPGDPGSALVWFELLVRPIIRRLFGHQHVFRRSIKAMVAEPVTSREGAREFRPAMVAERRGGGHTVHALDAGALLVSSLTQANGLMVLSDQVGTVPAGAAVDVMLLDRE